MSMNVLCMYECDNVSKKMNLSGCLGGRVSLLSPKQCCQMALMENLGNLQNCHS